MGNSTSTTHIPQGLGAVGNGDVIFTVDNVQYVAPLSEIDLSSEEPDLNLVTLIQAPEGDKAIDEGWIKDTVNRFETSDDVFQISFLSAVIFVTASNHSKFEITDGARKFLQSKGTHSVRHVPQLRGHESLLPGPYVIVQNRLRTVWRLYDDSYGTFVSTLRPQSGPFVESKFLGSDNTFPAVAVSSRLRSEPAKDKPLNGLRFAAKDNFNLKGIRTSFGSKAYLNTYGPQSETAETVKQLIGLGATITGKVKMTQFGNWEEPIQSADYQAPWNPRADGFQSPGGSSSGPAAALAAYEWLDVTLGSDTAGSVMRPALWNGVFSLRPTYQAVPYEGVGSGVEFLDSVGCFTRDLAFLREFSNIWLDHSRLIENPECFTSIVWPSDMWAPVDKDQQDLARAFVTDLETHLGLKTSASSFQQQWKKSPPENAGASSLDDYMNEACKNIFYEYYQHLKGFAQEHTAKFGCPPYLSSPNVKFWEYLERLSKSDYTEAVEHVDVYRSWFWKQYFDSGNSHPLFVLPIEYSAPRYRDEIPNFKKPPPGVNSLALSPIMKAPELLLPIGELPYQSRITKREEKLPFVIGLMSTPGTDLFLVDKILDVLRKSGRPAKVGTGRSMWPKG